MKSRKSELVNIQYLLDEISALEPLIEMHRSNHNVIMLKQYEARKLKFFKELLVLLIDSPINVDEPRSFFLVRQLMEQYYPAQTQHLSDQPEARLYAEVLAPAVASLSVAQEPVVNYQKK